MDIEEKYKQLLEKYQKNLIKYFYKIGEGYPLFIHGTKINELKSIWDSEIKPSEETGPLIIIRNQVCIQKVGYGFFSGYGDLSLIIDGEKLDKKKIGFHEFYQHHTHDGPISIDAVLGIYIPKDKQAKNIYRITNKTVPIIGRGDELYPFENA